MSFVVNPEPSKNKSISSSKMSYNRVTNKPLL